jgi:hypothetical protein
MFSIALVRNGLAPFKVSSDMAAEPAGRERVAYALV